MPAPQIIGRPSEVDPLLQRAGQRAAEVERAAARRRLATERDNGRADTEWDARVGSRGPLLHPGAAEGPAEPAGGLQDRHGVGERAQESASLPQIRNRPARRPRPQVQTPFGLNNVPIPVSSGSERSRVSRQSRGDRGPLGTQPSSDALRQASEPEAA